MKRVKKLLALVLALALCLGAFVLPTAQAESGVKAKFGAFAAKTSDKLFMALPVSPLPAVADCHPRNTSDPPCEQSPYRCCF